MLPFCVVSSPALGVNSADPPYSLLCGVQELVLAAAAVADPDAHVRPQTADCVDIAALQLGDLHRVYVLHPLGVDLKGGDSRCRSVSCLIWKCGNALQTPAPMPARVCLPVGAWVCLCLRSW